MKTAVYLLVTLLMPTFAGAQSFRSYQIEVEQGDVLVMNISPQWRVPGVPNSAISIFGEQYLPNSRGDVFIGVGLDKLGKYSARLIEYGSRETFISLDIVEVEVVRSVFAHTRTAAYSGPPLPRTGREVSEINKAFDLKNKPSGELAKNLYAEPLRNGCDVIDSFGLIYRNNIYKAHRGVDCRAPVGTAVYATNSGVVVMTARRFSKEGNMVILYHGLGIFSVYMHLSRIDVSKGQQLAKGQQLGLSGATGAGASRDPHLHFSIRINKTYVDPLKFIAKVNDHLR